MKKITTLLFISFAIAVHAQQVNLFSHSFYKPMVYNPAFTGYEENVTNVLLVSHSQWVDFKGAPRFIMLLADGSMMEKKMGIGLGLVSDRKGLVNRTVITPSYSYRLTINDNTHLMFGIALNIIDQTIDYSKALVENFNDPTLFTGMEHTTGVDGNAGLAFVWKDLELGAAVPQLIGNKMKYVDNTNVRAYYTQVRHYMGSVKYRFFISKEKGIAIVPQAGGRFIPNAPFQYEGNINLDWKDKFWIGAAYKSNYALGANVGILLYKQLYVGYSYDFIIGNIGKYSGMSSELLLNFKFGKNKKPEPASEIHEVAKEAPETKTIQDSVNVKRIDSLAMELKKNQDKLQALNRKLDEQSKIQADQLQQLQEQQEQQQQQQVLTKVVPNNENQNRAIIAKTTERVVKNHIAFVTNNVKDFKDVNNNLPKKGFYIVVGTFFYRDFAIAETKRFINRGFKNTSRLFNEQKQYNNVYIARVNTEEDALKKVKEAKAAGVKDIWVQVLIE